jgi:hypothetical protein
MVILHVRRWQAIAYIGMITTHYRLQVWDVTGWVKENSARVENGDRRLSMVRSWPLDGRVELNQTEVSITTN